MALFDRLVKRAELHARAAAGSALDAVERAAAEVHDIMLQREGDQLIISGRGLLRRWLTDARLRLAFWRNG